MAKESHRGASPDSPLKPSGDPRTNELDFSLRGIEAIVNRFGTSVAGPIRDMYRALTDPGIPNPELCRGLVIHPLATLGWFKVQVAGIGTISCTRLSFGSAAPLGVRDLGGIAPNSIVTVYKPNKFPFGYILGVEPPQTLDGSLPNPDWLFQGGQSGYRREDVHNFPMKSLHRGGYITNMAGHRPLDGTNLERGFITSTGLALTIDDYAFQLRVNEQAGLFGSYFDGWVRLAGMQLDIESLVHEVMARDDEGESHFFQGIAAYPWEALGLYDSGTNITQTYSDKEVVLDEPVGKVDLPKADLDLDPVYRTQEWGGYLGQGSHRLVVKPAKESGKRKRSDTDYDEGLFAETIGLDGAYSLRSAKELYIGKRCKIVVPRRAKAIEDGYGDDGQADNYKFSGKHGGGDEHKVKEIQVEGEYKSMRRVSAVQDLIAHQVNWRSLHPFHYHKLDYTTKQESEQSKNFFHVQEHLNFDQLENQPWLDDPEPKKLKIDHRLSDAEYFERESFLYFAPDGGIILSSGMGAALVLTSDFRAEAPGDVQLTPGRDLVSLADQTIIRSRGSIDLTTMKDLRLKAEYNLHMLAANSEEGSLLIESKSDGMDQPFDKKIGEEVKARGIIVKSKGVLGLIGEDVYVRSTTGNVVLDANRGQNDLLGIGRNINLFAKTEVGFYYGPTADSSKVNLCYRFGNRYCQMDVPLNVGGRVVSFLNGGGGSGGGGTGFFTDGRIACLGGVMAGGRMSDSNGGMLSKTPPEAIQGIQQTVDAPRQQVEPNRTRGQTQYESDIVQKLYQKDKPGHPETLELIGFSLRDKPDEKQYKTQKFRWVESRWTQMTRLGEASGGKPWQEKPVRYQGEELYPYPGKKKWYSEPAFLQLESLTMFDAAAGYSKPRPYEEPKLAGWTPVTMMTGLKLIRSSE